MLRAVWVVLTAIALLVLVFAQPMFLTVFSGHSIGYRNCNVKVSATRASTNVLRIIRKRQTGAISISQTTTKPETSSSSSKRLTTGPTIITGAPESTGYPSITTTFMIITDGGYTSIKPSNTGKPTGRPSGAGPTATSTGGPTTPAADEAHTGFPKWALGVVIPVLGVISGAVFAANCCKRRQKLDKVPIPTPPPENHNEKLLPVIRGPTYTPNCGQSP